MYNNMEGSLVILQTVNLSDVRDRDANEWNNNSCTQHETY